MTNESESMAPSGASDRRPIASCKVGFNLAAFHILAALFALASCAPPTEVIDLHDLPQASQDAMLQVKILPIGMPAPVDAGSIGPLLGYGCAQSPGAASSEAIRQLRVKAMIMRATGVVDVIIEPSDSGFCLGFSAVARGTAVAPRGIAPSY